VRAAAAGEVRFAGTAGSSGLTISIRTTDGHDTSYLHLSALDVRAGARVSAGERIGAVGTTGARSAPVPHLHFGVRDAGTRHAYHDPLAFLPPAPPASPAPEPPAPAPAPQPSPSPPAPVPVPAGAPGPERSPREEPRPHHVPDRPPARHPVGGRLRTPLSSVPRAQPLAADPLGLGQGPAARAEPLAADLAGLRQGPPVADRGKAARPTLAARGGPDALPGRADSESELPSVEHAGAGARADPPNGVERASGGSDIGWVLACAGLLLAAAVLGLTEDGRRAGSRTRTVLRAHSDRARAARG